MQSAAIGGKSYASSGSFDLSLLPVDISKFVAVARRIAPSYVLVLPRCIIPQRRPSRDPLSTVCETQPLIVRNIDPAQAAGLAVDGPWRCELNKHCGAPPAPPLNLRLD